MPGAVALFASLVFLACDQATDPDPLFFALTVSVSGQGMVHSTPQGILCGSDCAENYVAQSTVTLAAIPAAGWHLAEWAGACADTSPAISCTVPITEDQHASAVFEEES